MGKKVSSGQRTSNCPQIFRFGILIVVAVIVVIVVVVVPVVLVDVAVVVVANDTLHGFFKRFFKCVLKLLPVPKLKKEDLVEE